MATSEPTSNPEEAAAPDNKNEGGSAPEQGKTKTVAFAAVLLVVALIIMGVIISVRDSNDDDSESPALAPGTSAPSGTFSLSIFHVNDHHSHLDQADFGISGTDVGLDEIEEITVNYGGYPRVVSLFRELEANGGNYLKLHAGDAVTGTTYYSLFEGIADAAMMNLVCFDAFALGNHEFDSGDETLANFLKELQADEECPDTPVLSANLVPGNNSPLKELVDSGKLAKNHFFDFDGISVGVIGIDIRNKTMLSSSPSAGTTLLDEVETATSQVQELSALGIDKIVLLTHIGYDNDLNWMVEIPGVDVIVGGDSHSLLGDESKLAPVGFPVGPYPTMVEASDGRKVCVVTAWEYAHGVGKLDIEFDSDGLVTSCTGMTVIPFDPAVFVEDGELTEEQQKIVIEYLEEKDFVALEEDAAAQAALQIYSDQVEILRQTVIATVPEGICFERIPGEGRSQICSPEETLSQGGGACNLVAQAFLFQAFTADFAIQNGGGCRSDIDAGNFTVDDAYTMLPFSNTLVTLEMTGSEIELVLEQALENAFVGGSTGAYPYASGLRYSVDSTAEFGSRLSNLEINPRLEGEWMSIDSDATYTVVANNFIAAGGDGYFAFMDVEDELVTDLFIEYAQAFVDYAESVETLVDLPLELYSTQEFIAEVSTGTKLTILHINDHHSHLEGDEFTLAGSDIGIELEEVSVAYGGFPRIASLFNMLQSESDNVLKLHAGDAITGTLFFTAYQGEADADLMEYVCFDAFALGNHEFDQGDEALATFIEQLQSAESCPDTPVLSANLVPDESSPLKTLMDDSKILPSTIFTLEDGAEIGVIGINIRNKTILSSSPSDGTTYLDEVATATAEVEALTAAGVDKIVLLTHIGYENDLDWMVEIPGVDVIVGGDSHSLLGDETELAVVGFPVGPYPTAITASDGRTVCVVTAWEYAHGVGKLDIEFDESGAVTSCDGQTVFPFDPSADSMAAGDVAVSETDAAAVVAYLESMGSSYVAVTPDAGAQEALDSYAGGLEEIRSTVIATVPEGICYERTPGLGRSTICTPEETASQGGGVCNLVAQAFLFQSFTADVAIQNGGGCRSDIYAGNYTMEDAYTLLPFSNTLVNLEMSGEAIKLVLEQALENALVAASTGAYPYASGLRFDVNGTQPFGSRITNLEVNSRLEGDWETIDMSATYTVVTNSFTSTGGDGYFAFAEVDEELVLDTYIEYAQSFIDYATDEGILLDPPLEYYSTQSFIPYVEVDEPATGTTLRILHINDHHSHLASDSFTVNGTVAGASVEEVSVAYGGYPLIVSLFNELESEASNVLKLHAGDAITGTTFFTLYEGVADAAMMSYVCFDAFALGNHEFDQGDEALAAFLEDLQSRELCPDTPVLSANLVPDESSPLKTLMDDSKILPSTIFTLEDGAEIGVIGINIRNKTILSSSPSDGTTYLDEVATATAEVEALTAAGVDKIVLLTHIGYENDLDWMVEIPGVDVIVGGDSHSLLGDETELAVVGFPVGPYPTAITASDGRTVCVVTAWEYSHGVGKLDIEFDESGAVTSCDGQTVFPFDPSADSMAAGDVAVSETDAAAVVAYLESMGSSYVAVTPDAGAQEALAVYSEGTAALANMTIATVPEGICYERIPGQGRSTICTPEETASQGGGVCNLVAQAFLFQAFTADVAIQNGGGCRSDIYAGNYTMEDAYTLLPFSNTLVTLEMSGAEITLVLEQALENAFVDGSTGAYPYASGLRFDVNASATFGERLSNIEVNSRLEDGWSDLDENAMYTVVTNNFIADGGDGYFEFAEIDAGLVTDLYLEYAQTFVDYALDVGVLVDPPVEYYSTKSYTP